MNFLAHLYLVRDDEDLMLGGLLGDFVRGRRALKEYPAAIARGIRLHRRIDWFTDQAQQVRALKASFPKPFRRFSGIVIDLSFDHELARRWSEFNTDSLADFDREIRALLARHRELLPRGLVRFMAYADRRGLFAAYRREEEMLRSLEGIGNRLSYENPLDRVDEIWPEVRDECRTVFAGFLPRVQSEVDAWRNLRSTSTGS